MASGKLPIPFAQAHPIEFSFVGGAAIFVVAIFVGYWTYGPQTNGRECDITYQRAQQSLAMNQFHDAVKLFQQTVDNCPKNAYALSGLSRAEARLGRYDRAVIAAKKALDLDPKDEILEFNLARLYLVLNDNPTALERFKKLLAKTPADMNVHYNLALAYQRLGRFDEAKPHYEEVFRQKGELSEAAAFNLAAGYAQHSTDCSSRESREAISLLRTSLQLAQQAERLVVRKRRISGSEEVENGEKLVTLRRCDAFRRMMAEFPLG